MENKLAFIRTSFEKPVQSPAVPVKGVEGGSPFSVGRISAGGCAMDFPIDGISQTNVGVDGAEKRCGQRGLQRCYAETSAEPIQWRSAWVASRDE